MELLILIVGIFIGGILTRLIFKKKDAGTMRVYTTDMPDEGPYLCLEVDNGREGLNSLLESKRVSFKVDISNYVAK